MFLVHLIILLLASCQQAASSGDPFSCVIEPALKKNIFDLKPQNFKQDGRPKATAGVIMYYPGDEGPYILLGQESSEDDALDNYSEFGGSVELKSNGESEDFSQASLRELAEESIGIYRLSHDYLTNNSVTCYQKKSNREVVINFVKAPYYINSKFFLEARALTKIKVSQDKKDFRWIKLQDLLMISHLEDKFYQLTDIENQPLDIKFRPYFIDMFNDADVRQALNKL